VGLYYYTQEIDSFTRQVFVIPGVLSLGRDAGPDFETTSTAAFAELKYAATEDIKLIAGARYTWEDLDGTFTRTQTPDTTLPFPDVEFYSYETDGSDPSWRLGAIYEIDAGMVYATVSRGYKGPTVNVLADYVLSDPRGIYVDPEFALSYELGLKATWMDGRLTTNLAVFDTEFDDFQAQTYDATTFPGQYRLTNAGKLSTQGIELDLTMHWDYLTLTTAVAYIDAEFDDFGAPCYVGQTEAQGCLPIPGAGGITEFDASGSGIPGSPDWSYAITAAYGRAINGRLNWHLIGNYYWQDDVSFSAAGDPNLEQDDYGLFNLNAGVSSADGKWTASLFAKNLFDKSYVHAVVSTAFFPGSYSQFPAWGGHREYGLSLEVNF
jgi:iron complex outermembrane receptor protein